MIVALFATKLKKWRTRYGRAQEKLSIVDSSCCCSVSKSEWNHHSLFLRYVLTVWRWKILLIKFRWIVYVFTYWSFKFSCWMFMLMTMDLSLEYLIVSRVSWCIHKTAQYQYNVKTFLLSLHSTSINLVSYCLYRSLLVFPILFLNKIWGWISV